MPVPTNANLSRSSQTGNIKRGRLNHRNSLGEQIDLATPPRLGVTPAFKASGDPNERLLSSHERDRFGGQVSRLPKLTGCHFKFSPVKLQIAIDPHEGGTQLNLF